MLRDSSETKMGLRGCSLCVSANAASSITMMFHSATSMYGLAARSCHAASSSTFLSVYCHCMSYVLFFSHKSDIEILFLSRNRFGAKSVCNSDFQYRVLSTSAQYTTRSTQYTVQRTLRHVVQITSPSMCGSVCVSIS